MASLVGISFGLSAQRCSPLNPTGGLTAFSIISDRCSGVRLGWFTGMTTACSGGTISSMGRLYATILPFTIRS